MSIVSLAAESENLIVFFSRDSRGVWQRIPSLIDLDYNAAGKEGLYGVTRQVRDGLADTVARKLAMVMGTDVGWIVWPADVTSERDLPTPMAWFRSDGSSSRFAGLKAQRAALTRRLKR